MIELPFDFLKSGNLEELFVVSRNLQAPATHFFPKCRHNQVEIKEPAEEKYGNVKNKFLNCIKMRTHRMEIANLYRFLLHSTRYVTPLHSHLFLKIASARKRHTFTVVFVSFYCICKIKSK